MAILYSLVARGAVVLAEFSAASGNAGTVARRILEKLPSGTDTRVSYSQDRHIFHIMRADGLTFLCMANDTFGRRIPFAYLEDIHMRFMKTYGQTAFIALAYAMNDEFSRVLHQQMEYFCSNPNADTINRVKGEMNEESLSLYKSRRLVFLSHQLCAPTCCFAHNDSRPSPIRPPTAKGLHILAFRRQDLIVLLEYSLLQKSASLFQPIRLLLLGTPMCGFFISFLGLLSKMEDWMISLQGVTFLRATSVQAVSRRILDF